jgi:hypothetical protein
MARELSEARPQPPAPGKERGGGARGGTASDSDGKGALVPYPPYPARTRSAAVGEWPATATARQHSSPPARILPGAWLCRGLGAAELPATARVRQLSSPPGPHLRSAAVGGGQQQRQQRSCRPPRTLTWQGVWR